MINYSDMVGTNIGGLKLRGECIRREEVVCDICEEKGILLTAQCPGLNVSL